MMKTQYAEAHHTASRYSGVTASVLSKQIVRVQVMTDPGGKHSIEFKELVVTMVLNTKANAKIC